MEFFPEYEGPERAIHIDVPGEGPVTFKSKNLPPEMMRWMRDMSGRQ